MDEKDVPPAIECHEDTKSGQSEEESAPPGPSRGSGEHDCCAYQDVAGTSYAETVVNGRWAQRISGFATRHKDLFGIASPIIAAFAFIATAFSAYFSHQSAETAAATFQVSQRPYLTAKISGGPFGAAKPFDMEHPYFGQELENFGSTPAIVVGSCQQAIVQDVGDTTTRKHECNDYSKSQMLEVMPKSKESYGIYFDPYFKTDGKIIKSNNYKLTIFEAIKYKSYYEAEYIKKRCVNFTVVNGLLKEVSDCRDFNFTETVAK